MTKGTKTKATGKYGTGETVTKTTNAVATKGASKKAALDATSSQKKVKTAFKFTAANDKAAKAHLAKYPDGKKSAVMPILEIAQRQNANWCSDEVIEYVAAYMDMPPIRVREIATFYEMYNTEPVGENVVWVCRTTPCWLRGSDEVLSACKKNMKIDVGETTKDGKFTLREMECLGACVNAPILWVGDDYYEDVDAKDTDKIIGELRKGNRPPVGSLKGRQCAAPEGFTPKEAKK